MGDIWIQTCCNGRNKATFSSKSACYRLESFPCYMDFLALSCVELGDPNVNKTEERRSTKMCLYDR